MVDGIKKHPCPDCSCCQWCSDARCGICFRKGGGRRKLSLQEQIEAYELLNREREDGPSRKE
ncbi:MAG: hypothetical protein PHG20_12995 [Geobacteraceae bacterium]|nr:hypothetical protein [Geobacteraceae bacterium]